MKRSYLKRKTPLKRGASQLKRTPLRRQSEKAKAEAFIWSAVKKERANLLIDKYGFLICEFCKNAITSGQICDGHHANKNRRDNSVQNCRLVHRFPCHNTITDNTTWVEGLL